MCHFNLLSKYSLEMRIESKTWCYLHRYCAWWSKWEVLSLFFFFFFEGWKSNIINKKKGKRILGVHDNEHRTTKKRKEKKHRNQEAMVRDEKFSKRGTVRESPTPRPI